MSDSLSLSTNLLIASDTVVLLIFNSRFSCRCYEKLMQLAKDSGKKYHHFSLANYGECWTSEALIYKIGELGVDDLACIGNDFRVCNFTSDYECFGEEYSQFVYHVHYDDEPFVNELEILNSECKIETLTVCSAPTTSYTTSTVHP